MRVVCRLRRQMRVLVVEDERKVADALCDGLQAEHYDVEIERTGEGAFYRSSTEMFDVILLDLSLPERCGLDVLAAIRRNGNSVPVIVLTARDSVEDRVLGLDAGADDLLVKPFAFANCWRASGHWSDARPASHSCFVSARWRWTGSTGW